MSGGGGGGGERTCLLCLCTLPLSTLGHFYLLVRTRQHSHGGQRSHHETLATVTEGVVSYYELSLQKKQACNTQSF